MTGAQTLLQSEASIRVITCSVSTNQRPVYSAQTHELGLQNMHAAVSKHQLIELTAHSKIVFSGFSQTTEGQCTETITLAHTLSGKIGLVSDKQPITVQYSGHVNSINQSQAIIQVT